MANPRLLVEPKSELVFTGPFDSIVSSTIKLTNTTSQRVCFKVKTTVPKSYCVKPSSGFVEPNGTLDVEVLLQPSSQMPADRSKHKFMVQSMIAPDDPKVDIEQLWKEALPGDLQDSKLKCVMKMPEEIVSISPSSNLMFEGPFTSPSPALIKITNNSSVNICFKIQITNPKMFSVTPVSGLVEPYATQNVKVVMHPWEFDPSQKYKDRFLIQWVTADTYSDSVFTDSIARNDRILKCTYHLPESNVAKNTTSFTESTPDASADPAKLYAELKKLRQENTTLKENDLRLRKLVKNEDSNRPSSSTTASHSPLSQQQWIILMVVALIIGIILGKIVS